MNRDLLYSLGLALAAWPPLFGEAPNLEPVEPPLAIHATARNDASICAANRVLPAAFGNTRSEEPKDCETEEDYKP